MWRRLLVLLMGGLLLAGDSAGSQAKQERARARSAMAALEVALGSPVPAGRVTVWEARVKFWDIWGGCGISLAPFLGR